MNQGVETVAVIPAFNEQKTIVPVITAAMCAESVDAVVVVDDGSTDATQSLAIDTQTHLAKKKLIVASHSANEGKAEAMLTGAAVARQIGGATLKTLVFIDADLSPIWSRDGENRKLTQKLYDKLLPQAEQNRFARNETVFINNLAFQIDRLVQPVHSGEYLMTIGMPERNRFIDSLRMHLNWGAFGGNRAVSLALWDQIAENCLAKDIQIHGWEMEAALNSYMRCQRNPEGTKLNHFIGKILLTDVVNVGSRVKAGGFWKGLERMAQIQTTSLLALVRYGREFSA